MREAWAIVYGGHVVPIVISILKRFSTIRATKIISNYIILPWIMFPFLTTKEKEENWIKMTFSRKKKSSKEEKEVVI